MKLLLDTTAVVAAISHMLLTCFLPFSANHIMQVHLSFSLIIVYLLATLEKKGRSKLFATAMLVLSIVSAIYIHSKMDYLELHSGWPDLPVHVYFISAIMALLLVEGVRRSFGITVIIIISIFAFYPLVGEYLPGFLHISGLSPKSVLFRITIGSMGAGGIYGSLLGISASVIFVFIVFGSVMQATGATKCFLQVAKILESRLEGGPGLTAVICSALMGMITGSPAANVATTGAFTIPMMKKVGYTPEQAGAIEAASSVGGQIMPPVMGYVAFLMIAMTGVLYFDLMVMIAIPAVLYYLCIGLYVQFTAVANKVRRKGMAPLEVTSSRPDMSEILYFGPLFVIPLIVLVVLVIKNFPLGFAASTTIVVMVGLALARKESRTIFLESWKSCITTGVINAARVALLSAALGMMLESMGMIAILLEIPYAIIRLSGDILIVGLFLTMIVSFIIGCGVSATMAYVLVAIVISPALSSMGLDPLETHLFALWYAVLAFLTPPMAVGAAIASSVANSRFWPTSIEAVKVTSGAFLIPFLMIYCPAIKLRPSPLMWWTLELLGAIMVIILMQTTICGAYLVGTISARERFFSGIGALLILVGLFNHISSVTLIGMLVFSFITFRQIILWKNMRKHEA